ncbi:MAG: AzlD domain-containing protein, partial [Deltaproteobacteria bacterium]|nr:AzlD domain-containing protein [Deltaproteobacteria bacterium]
MRYADFWLVVIFLGLGTFTIRASVIYLSRFIVMTGRTKQVLSLIPAAVFPAFFVPLAFFHQGSNQLLLGKERLVVLICATVICYYSK